MTTLPRAEMAPTLIDRDVFDGFAAGTTSSSHLTQFWHTGLRITDHMHSPDPLDSSRERPRSVNLHAVLECMRSIEAGNEMYLHGLGPASWNLYADLIKAASTNTQDPYTQVLEWDPNIHPKLVRRTGSIALAAAAKLDAKYIQSSDLSRA